MVIGEKYTAIGKEWMALNGGKRKLFREKENVQCI